MRDRVVSFTILGNPIAKARARIRQGYERRMFDSQIREKIAMQIMLSKLFNAEPFEGPIAVDLKFHMAMCISNKVSEGSWHYYKADLDNLIKWILDIFQPAIVFRDDCIVSQINAVKIYGRIPRTEVTIRELDYVKKTPKTKTAHNVPRIP